MSFFLFYFLILAIAGIMLLKERANQRNEDRGIVDINNVANFMEEFQDDEKAIDDKPLIAVLKDASLDINRIQEYKGTNIKKFEFRPQKWEQFIGQEEGKERAKTIIKKANRGIKAHLILSAIQGHGKTTYIELLAKTLKAKLIQRIGKQIDEENLIDIINEINSSKEKHVVFFIDEIDAMNWKVIKILNPIIEQFQIAGKKIKPFIFACATINKHILIKNNPDTLDRISHHLQFTRYSDEEIKTILTQYKKQLYPSDEVNEKILDIISKNCKYNPRTSLVLLEDYIVERDINKVLRTSKIIKEGLNFLDIKILEALIKSKKPMGVNAVALKVGLTQNQYVREFEPYLYEFGYIGRTPSRIITDKGKKLLKLIKGGEK